MAEHRHLTFFGAPRLSVQEKVSEIHRENDLFDHWYAEWSTYYGELIFWRMLNPDRLGITEGDYLRDICKR